MFNLPLGLSGVSSERIGEADHSELQWWLEWYANTGVTAAVASVNVTYGDDTTGVIGVPAPSTMKAPNLIPILPLPAGKTGLKAVNSVQLNVSTGIAGNLGVTCTRLRASVFAVQSSRSEILDWAALGLPEIYNDSCLMLTHTQRPRTLVPSMASFVSSRVENFMAITSTDQLIAALCNSQHVLFDKSSVSFATAGRFFSLWRAPWRPGLAVIPTAPGICTKETLGALTYLNAPPLQTSYMAWLDIATGNANTTL